MFVYGPSCCSWASPWLLCGSHQLTHRRCRSGGRTQRLAPREMPTMGAGFARSISPHAHRAQRKYRYHRTSSAHPSNLEPTAVFSQQSRPSHSRFHPWPQKGPGPVSPDLKTPSLRWTPSKLPGPHVRKLATWSLIRSSCFPVDARSLTTRSDLDW